MFLSALPCAYILFRGNSLTLTELQVCVAVIALGAGPIFSLTVAFAQDFFPVDISISGLFFLGHAVGQKFWAPLMGELMVFDPFVLFWVPAANAVVCSVAFIMLAVSRMSLVSKMEEEGRLKSSGS